MRTKAAFAIGLVMLFSPAVASADTSNISSLIATLTALVVQLEHQLAQLLASKGASTSMTSSSTAPQTAADDRCARFAGLKRGDMDATTGGKVSQLQNYLGITPVSGYYGSQTGIGYQNKCGNLGNAQPASVPGMTQYKSVDFTFWYPSTWKVESQDVPGQPAYLIVSDADGKGRMTIEEIEPPQGRLLTVIARQESETYYFDANASVWMHGHIVSGQTTATAADMTQMTMGGLHMFYLSGGLMYEDVVPLSATRFLRVIDSSFTHDVRPLVRTIVATNPNVATPVATTQQIATIKALLGASGSDAPPAADNFGTYTNRDFGISLNYDRDLFTTQAPEQGSYMGRAELPHTFFSLYFKGGQAIAGFDGASLVLAADTTVNYEDCTRMQNSTTQVTVGGRTFYRDTGGDAAMGHYASLFTYRTYYNGACYEVAYQINSYRVDAGTPGDSSPVEQTLRNVVNSITFTGADTAPVSHASAAPAWKTMTAQKTPVSFTYPGSFSVYESNNETDVGPAQLIGLQRFQTSIVPGAISIQMTPHAYFRTVNTASQAMQASMQTEAVGYPSTAYTLFTLGGESAYTRGDTTADGFTVIYVAHGDAYFRILLMGPLLPSEYKTFLNTFEFTN